MWSVVKLFECNEDGLLSMPVIEQLQSWGLIAKTIALNVKMVILLNCACMQFTLMDLFGGGEKGFLKIRLSVILNSQ